MDCPSLQPVSRCTGPQRLSVGIKDDGLGMSCRHQRDLAISRQIPQVDTVVHRDGQKTIVGAGRARIVCDAIHP